MINQSNLAAQESLALSALAAGGRVANLLSPTGATRAAVSDILAAAGGAISIVNTANAVLSSFTSLINDPIKNAFSSGQPYGGTFITAPSVSQITPVDFSQSLAASSQNLAQLSPAQQAALAAQTGVTLVTDADLATAMATVFASTQANFKLAFSINLSDNQNIVPITPVQVTPTASVVTIPPLTPQPDITQLSAFVSSIIGAFPNVPGIEGVAASIWVDNLGVSVSSSGAAIAGVPAKIAAGLYGDITTATSTLVPSVTPIAVVDYSYQQNQTNLLVALAIDNGLTTTMTGLLGSSLVTAATHQVIKNRLASVAQRGDAAMLYALFTALGPAAIPNAIGLLTTLLLNLQPSDQPTAGLAPVITASGITLTTTTTGLTTTELIALIEEMLSLTGTTMAVICSQNTCNSVFCSQSLLNTTMIKVINPAVITALLDTTTVQMARMF